MQSDNASESVNPPEGGSHEQALINNQSTSPSSPTPPSGLDSKTNGFQRAMFAVHAGTCVLAENIQQALLDGQTERAFDLLSVLVNQHMCNFGILCNAVDLPPKETFEYYVWRVCQKGKDAS